MKLTKLDEDNIRILLEKEDLEKYNISFELIKVKSIKTKEAFWKIVNAAHEKSGFNPTGNKLLIEAFPKSNGEVLLYVTRLPEESNLKTGESGKTYLFSFNDADAFLGAYREINETRLELMEKKHYIYNGTHYLYFMPVSITVTDARLLEKLLLSLYEYGQEITPVNFRYFLEEHAQNQATI